MTKIKVKDERYLHLEQIMPCSSGVHSEETDYKTLLFHRNIDNLPDAALSSWKAQRVLALLAPGYGARARYQALKNGFWLIITPFVSEFREDDPLIIDPALQRWYAKAGLLEGSLSMEHPISRELAAFLASIKQWPLLGGTVREIVEYGYDPAVKRL